MTFHFNDLSIKPVITDMVVLHNFFSIADKKVTKTQPECDVIYILTKWHIHINIGISKKAILQNSIISIRG